MGPSDSILAQLEAHPRSKGFTGVSKPWRAELAHWMLETEGPDTRLLALHKVQVGMRIRATAVTEGWIYSVDGGVNPEQVFRSPITDYDAVERRPADGMRAHTCDDLVFFGDDVWWLENAERGRWTDELVQAFRGARAAASKPAPMLAIRIGLITTAHNLPGVEIDKIGRLSSTTPVHNSQLSREISRSTLTTRTLQRLGWVDRVWCRVVVDSSAVDSVLKEPLSGWQPLEWQTRCPLGNTFTPNSSRPVQVGHCIRNYPFVAGGLRPRATPRVCRDRARSGNCFGRARRRRDVSTGHACCPTRPGSPDGCRVQLRQGPPPEQPGAIAARS